MAQTTKYSMDSGESLSVWKGGRGGDRQMKLISHLISCRGWDWSEQYFSPPNTFMACTRRVWTSNITVNIYSCTTLRHVCYCRDVRNSNTVGTNCRRLVVLTEYALGTAQPILAPVGFVRQITSRLLPSTFFPIHYSAVYHIIFITELLTGSLSQEELRKKDTLKCWQDTVTKIRTNNTAFAIRYK
jgi:hypothetical protein